MNKRDIAPKDIIRLKETVAVISKFTGNEICADCQYSRSLWASVNFGVFLCSECAGIHRGLGVHISQVRSVTLDDWTPSQVFSVLINGNFYVNRLLLKYNKNNRKMTPDMDPGSKARFVQDKYDNGRLGTKDGLLLVNRDTFPKLTVDAVISMYEKAVQLYNKGVNHVELRYEFIQNAGYPNMSAIPNDLSPIYLRVPPILTKKSSGTSGKKPIAVVVAPQQKPESSPPPPQNDQLVDLDFGEMKSAAPIQNNVAPHGIVEHNFVDFGIPTTVPPAKTSTGLDDIFAGLDVKDNKASMFDVNSTISSTKNDDWPTVGGSSNGNSLFKVDNSSSNNDFWPMPSSQNTKSSNGFDLFAEPKRNSLETNNSQSLFNINKTNNTPSTVIAPSSDSLFGDILSTTSNKPMASIDTNVKHSHSIEPLDFPVFNSNNGCATNPVSSISFPQLNASAIPDMSNNKTAPGDDKDFILSLYR